MAAVSSATCQGRPGQGAGAPKQKDKGDKAGTKSTEGHSTAELEQMHLPGEEGMRHCLDPASSRPEKHQGPGMAAVPWWHWHSPTVAPAAAHRQHQPRCWLQLPPSISPSLIPQQALAALPAMAPAAAPHPVPCITGVTGPVQQGWGHQGTAQALYINAFSPPLKNPGLGRQSHLYGTFSTRVTSSSKDFPHRI